MDFICCHGDSFISWGQFACLSLVIFILIWLLLFVVRCRLCKRCHHPSAVDLRRYHASFLAAHEDVSKKRR
jgi:hypothetical protein